MKGDFADRLRAAGMSGTAAAAKGAMLNRAADALRAHGSAVDRAVAFFVPGRVEVLGKHTDYAGGRSLLCTVERGLCVVAAPRPDNQVAVTDVGWHAEARFALDPDLVPRAGHWTNYPMTVARRVARNFPAARRGADVAFVSDLPHAAGMSSSSMLLIGIFLAVAEINDIAASAPYRQNIRTPEDLAGYLATVENGQDYYGLAGDRGVGTFGGSEDHTAILCCRPGQLSQYRFCPVAHERDVELPAGHVFAIAMSGVAAEKTGAALETYNRASRAVQAILDAWRRATGRQDASLAAAVESSPEAADRIRQMLAASPEDGHLPVRLLAERFDQFLDEHSRIIPAAGDALGCGDLATFGGLVDRSQDNAERQLGNQIPETVFLARAAREHGALAASAFGAGFGGSVWALVPQARLDAFEREWSEAYRRAFPNLAGQAGFFSSPPGPAVVRVTD